MCLRKPAQAGKFLEDERRNMRVYGTEKGRKMCQEVIEHGYAWAQKAQEARKAQDLTTEELDCLRVMCDPIFGVDKLRADEVAEEDKPTWKKLAGMGLVQIET